MPIYAGKNMQYVHFVKIAKMRQYRNMPQCHICIQLSCLHSQPYAWSRSAVWSTLTPLVSVVYCNARIQKYRLLTGCWTPTIQEICFLMAKKNVRVCCGSSCTNEQVAVVLTAKGRITAATSRITCSCLTFPILHSGPEDALCQISSSPVGSWPPPGTCFLGPTRVYTPNSIMIGLAVLAQLTIMTTLHL